MSIDFTLYNFGYFDSSIAEPNYRIPKCGTDLNTIISLIKKIDKYYNRKFPCILVDYYSCDMKGIKEWTSP